MIRVSVFYSRSSGKKFDLEYYKNNHMPLVKEKLMPVKVEIDAGIPNNQNQPSHYIAIGHMTFETMGNTKLDVIGLPTSAQQAPQ